MSASTRERLDRLVLSLTFEPGDLRVASLVAQLGAGQLLEMLRARVVTRDVMADAMVRLPHADPDAVLDHADQIGARFIVPGDEEWPAGLDDLEHAGQAAERGGIPLGLWVKGERLDRLEPRVAIVGSRAATTYGVSAASTLAAELAAAGWVVVSGGALGIDEAAHRGALSAGGRTIVALAHGLDRVYPVANTALIERSATTGALISELAPGTAPHKIRFLSRNRLIAALSTGSVIVEAGTRSGALSTANWATRLSRPVLAVPGATTSEASRGTHELIRTGAAVLVTTGADVLEVIDTVGSSLLTPARAPERPRDRLDPRARQVLEAMPVARPVDVGSIASTAGMGIIDTQSAIRRLQESALVIFEAGGWRLSDEARVGRT